MTKEIIGIWYGLFMVSLALFFVLALDLDRTSARVTITRLPPDPRDIYGTGESTRRAAAQNRCILEMGIVPISGMEQIEICDKIFGR